MATKIKKGNIVKFKGRDGTKTGGVVIDIIEDIYGMFALINTFDNNNVKKRVSDLSLIQRQQRGRMPKNYIENLKEEINIENMNISESTEIPETNNGDMETVQHSCNESDAINPIDANSVQLRDEITSLRNDNEELRKQVASVESKVGKYNQYNSDCKNDDNKKIEMLRMSVIGLSDALNSLSTSDNAAAISSLTNTIMMLNGIKKEQ